MFPIPTGFVISIYEYVKKSLTFRKNPQVLE